MYSADHLSHGYLIIENYYHSNGKCGKETYGKYITYYYI